MFQSKYSIKPEKAVTGLPFKGQGLSAMILAAGLGTRLKPFTNHHPKALAQVNGKTVLQRNIEYLAGFGIRRIIVNVHHFADQIIDHVKKNKGFGSEVTFSDETKEVLETGGGIKKASWFFEGSSDPFFVMNADVLTDLNLAKMLDRHIEDKAIATLAVSQRNTSRYLLLDEEDTLCGWKNDSTGEMVIQRETQPLIEKAFSGIHLLSPSLFPLIKEEGKFSIIDTYLNLAGDHILKGYDHTGSRFIDIGKPESLAKAAEIFD